MKNYWLHRISYHAEISHPLLDKGFLTIGYSEFLREAMVVDTILADGENLDTLNRLSKDCWGGLLRTRYCLKHFINMKRGDIVVVPLNGTFDVYEIDDDKANIISELPVDGLKDWSGNNVTLENGLLKIEGEKSIVDLGFFRKVKPVVTEISRNDYAEEPLFRRLKMRQTTANISDIGEFVENAINRFRKEEKLDFNIFATENLVNALSAEISKINTDTKFEELVQSYFKSLGADSYIPAKNERGKENGADADVVAVFEPLKTIYYVQVKKHDKDSETDDWAVSQIKEYVSLKNANIDDGYSKVAWVVSSANKFSENAKKLAVENNVMLLTRDDFAKLLLRAGIKNNLQSK